MTDRQVDPWGDMPRWSDDAPAAEQVNPATDQATPATDQAAPTTHDQAAASASAPASASGAGPETPGDGPPTCSWCATPAAEGASRCASCGAALAQRESIGDLVIPGLTAVDPALKDLDGRPLHLSGPSPSHGVASGVIVAAVAGGPLGLAILGGVGAVAAAEYMGASRDKPGASGLDGVGETSEAVRLALERLERGEALPGAGDETPRPELDVPAGPGPRPGPSQAQSAAPDDGTKEASHGGS